MYYGSSAFDTFLHFSTEFSAFACFCYCFNYGKTYCDVLLMAKQGQISLSSYGSIAFRIYWLPLGAIEFSGSKCF